MKKLISKLFGNKDSLTDQEKLEEYVDKSVIIERIAAELIAIPELEDYKWLKSKNQFKLKTDFGNFRLDLENWVSFDVERDEACVTIRPQFFVRHDSLHAWFEEFSFKSKSDQRNTWTVGYSPSMIGLENECNFLRNCADFESDIKSLKLVIGELHKEIISYAELNRVFEGRIKEMINDLNFKFPKSGIEWAFEALILTKNFAPNDYSTFKPRIMNHIEKLHEAEEPNLREYYDRLDLIIDKLEKVKVPNNGN